ncbi:MAG: FMN-binding protein [Clostridia bacterium]|nr:FMN-binding protein [Clostridia bacterium]
MEQKKGIKYFIRIGGTLFLIAAFMAFALAVVNELTADKIAANAEKETSATITEIFGDGIEFTRLSAELQSPVKTVYEVTKDGENKGWAVLCAPVGFKAEIEMIVGVAPDGSCLTVRIISLSETPGLGAKVAENEFLSQYNEKTGGLEIKTDIAEVAGATISSSAVNDAVNAALDAVAVITGGEAQ